MLGNSNATRRRPTCSTSGIAVVMATGWVASNSISKRYGPSSGVNPVTDRLHRIQRAHRALKDDRRTGPPHRPELPRLHRSIPHRTLAEALVEHSAPGHLGGVTQPQKGQSGFGEDGAWPPSGWRTAGSAARRSAAYVGP